MSDVAKIENGKLVIELDAELIAHLLVSVDESYFISKEGKEEDPDLFEYYSVLEDINLFLPNIKDVLNSEDEIGMTMVLNMIVRAANTAADSGNDDGCES